MLSNANVYDKNATQEVCSLLAAPGQGHEPNKVCTSILKAQNCSQIQILSQGSSFSQQASINENIELGTPGFPSSFDDTELLVVFDQSQTSAQIILLLRELTTLSWYVWRNLPPSIEMNVRANYGWCSRATTHVAMQASQSTFNTVPLSGTVTMVTLQRLANNFETTNSGKLQELSRFGPPTTRVSSAQDIVHYVQDLYVDSLTSPFQADNFIGGSQVSQPVARNQAYTVFCDRSLPQDLPFFPTPTISNPVVFSASMLDMQKFPFPTLWQGQMAVDLFAIIPLPSTPVTLRVYCNYINLATGAPQTFFDVPYSTAQVGTNTCVLNNSLEFQAYGFLEKIEIRLGTNVIPSSIIVKITQFNLPNGASFSPLSVVHYTGLPQQTTVRVAGSVTFEVIPNPAIVQLVSPQLNYPSSTRENYTRLGQRMYELIKVALTSDCFFTDDEYKTALEVSEQYQDVQMHGGLAAGHKFQRLKEIFHKNKDLLKKIGRASWMIAAETNPVLGGVDKAYRKLTGARSEFNLFAQDQQESSEDFQLEFAPHSLDKAYNLEEQVEDSNSSSDWQMQTPPDNSDGEHEQVHRGGIYNSYGEYMQARAQRRYAELNSSSDQEQATAQAQQFGFAELRFGSDRDDSSESDDDHDQEDSVQSVQDHTPPQYDELMLRGGVYNFGEHEQATAQAQQFGFAELRFGSDRDDGSESDEDHTDILRGGDIERNPGPFIRQHSSFQVFTRLESTQVHMVEPTTRIRDILNNVLLKYKPLQEKDIFMTYQGKVLDPESTIQTYHITPDSTITIHLRCYGGSQKEGDDLIEKFTQMKLIQEEQRQQIVNALKELNDQHESEIDIVQQFLRYRDLMNTKCVKYQSVIEILQSAMIELDRRQEGVVQQMAILTERASNTDDHYQRELLLREKADLVQQEYYYSKQQNLILQLMQNPFDETVDEAAKELPEPLQQTVGLVQQRQIKIMSHAKRLKAQQEELAALMARTVDPAIDDRDLQVMKDFLKNIAQHTPSSTLPVSQPENLPEVLVDTIGLLKRLDQVLGSKTQEDRELDLNQMNQLYEKHRANPVVQNLLTSSSDGEKFFKDPSKSVQPKFEPTDRVKDMQAAFPDDVVSQSAQNDEEYTERPVLAKKKKKQTFQNNEDSESGYQTANEKFYDTKEEEKDQSDIVYKLTPGIRVLLPSGRVVEFKPASTLQSIVELVDQEYPNIPYTLLTGSLHFKDENGYPIWLPLDSPQHLTSTSQTVQANNSYHKRQESVLVKVQLEPEKLEEPYSEQTPNITSADESIQIQQDMLTYFNTQKKASQEQHVRSAPKKIYKVKVQAEEVEEANDTGETPKPKPVSQEQPEVQAQGRGRRRNFNPTDAYSPPDADTFNMVDSVDPSLQKAAAHLYPQMTDDKWSKILEGATHVKRDIDSNNAYIPLYVSTPLTINEVTQLNATAVAQQTDYLLVNTCQFPVVADNGDLVGCQQVGFVMGDCKISTASQQHKVMILGKSIDSACGFAEYPNIQMTAYMNYAEQGKAPTKSILAYIALCIYTYARSQGINATKFTLILPPDVWGSSFMAAVFAILARADCLRVYTGGAHLSVDWLKPFFRQPVQDKMKKQEIEHYMTKFKSLAETQVVPLRSHTKVYIYDDEGNPILNADKTPKLVPPMFEFYEVGAVRQLATEPTEVVKYFKTFKELVIYHFRNYDSETVEQVKNRFATPGKQFIQFVICDQDLHYYTSIRRDKSIYDHWSEVWKSVGLTQKLAIQTTGQSGSYGSHILFAGYISDLSSIPPMRYKKEAATAQKEKVQQQSVTKLSGDVTEIEQTKLKTAFQNDMDKVQVLMSKIDGWKPVRVTALDQFYPFYRDPLTLEGFGSSKWLDLCTKLDKFISDATKNKQYDLITQITNLPKIHSTSPTPIKATNEAIIEMMSADTAAKAAAAAKKLLPDGSVNASTTKYSKNLKELKTDLLSNMYATFKSFIPAGLWKSTAVPAGQYYNSTIASLVAAKAAKDPSGQVLSNRFVAADHMAETGVKQIMSGNPYQKPVSAKKAKDKTQADKDWAESFFAAPPEEAE